MTVNGEHLPVPAEMEALGPAMSALTVRQREFVRAVVSGCSQIEAVRRAGYSTKSRKSMEVQGVRTAHDPKVQAAILEEGIKLVRSAGPKSIAVLQSIAFNGRARDRDRIVAAVAILDRGGFGAMSSHRVDVHHHEPSRAEVKARLAAACDELGFTPEMKARALRVSEIELVEQTDGSFAPAAAVPQTTEVDNAKEG